MAKNVLVVGSPRSGTSLAAGIFARAGYHVTEEPDEDLREGDRHNPDGYWEAQSLIDRNVEIFHAVGYSAHNTWLFDPIGSEVVKEIARLDPLPGHREFAAAYGRHSPWVWKDPRLCYTLGYWWKILPSDSTCVLMTERDLDAIYRSFVRVGWREPSPEAHDDVFTRVKDHLDSARAAIREHDIPHFVMRYEDVASHPTSVASGISSLCEISVSPEDLGFDNRYDHSGLRGRISGALDRMATRMPDGPRRLAKRLIPRRLLAVFFPERTG